MAKKNLKILIKKAGKLSLDLIFPNRCPICNKINYEENGICQECWKKVTMLRKPACEICFYPFQNDEFEGTFCPSCIKKRPKYKKARSVFAYDNLIKNVIANFKYKDSTSNAKFFSDLMVKSCKDIIKDVDIIIPVPMHPKRLRKRKFNQASILAKGIAKKTTKKLIHEVLKRKVNTRPQVGLVAKERLKNVKGAFFINKRYLKEIRGKNILLVDDVMTTGATLENCAKVLLENKVKNVYVSTIARTVKGLK